MREAIAGLPEGPTYPSDGLQSLARLDQEEERLDQALSAILGGSGALPRFQGPVQGSRGIRSPGRRDRRLRQSAIRRAAKRVGVFAALGAGGCGQMPALAGYREWDFRSVQGKPLGRGRAAAARRAVLRWGIRPGLAEAVFMQAEAGLHGSAFLADLRERLETRKVAGRRDVAGDRRGSALLRELRIGGVLKASYARVENAIGHGDSAGGGC